MRRAWILACLFVVGCRPAPVYQLTSLDADARWLRGQQLVHREAEGVTLVVSFDRTWGEYLVFDVAFDNQSDSTILVDPTQFQYALVVARAGARAELSRRFAAIDPEERLGHLDRQASVEEASYQTSVMLNAIVEVGDAVEDLVEERTVAEQDLDTQQDNERAGENRQEAQDHEWAQASMAEQRDYWASRVLRRTHLEPGDTFGGKLALPAGAVSEFTEGTLRDGATRKVRGSGEGAEYTLTLRCPAGAATHELEFVIRQW